MTKNYLILLLSTILYIVSPQSYNFGICVICLCAFVVLAWDLLKENFKSRNYVTFNAFFLISTFFTSFCFPVFIMPSKTLYNAFESLSMTVFRFVDFSYITKATSLCLIAISIYTIGYKKSQKKYQNNDQNIEIRLNQSLSDMLLLISFLGVLLNVALSLRSSESTTSMSDNPFVYEIFKALVALTFISRIGGPVLLERGVSNFWHNNKLPLILDIIVALLFLYLGDRGTSISLVLIALGCLSLYYYRVKLVHLFLIGLVGASVLFAIRQTRKTDSSLYSAGLSSFVESSKESIQDQHVLLLFSDLIGISQELCIGYKIKDTKGLQNPEQILLTPFLPFPILPSLVCETFFDKTYKDMNGSSLINDYMGEWATSRYGAHCVSYIYMRWGFVGVLLLFYIFGFMIGKYTCRSVGYSAYYSVAFLLLFSLSIYIPRSSLLDIIRPLSYAYIFTYCVSRHSYLKSRYHL